MAWSGNNLKGFLLPAPLPWAQSKIVELFMNLCVMLDQFQNSTSIFESKIYSCFMMQMIVLVYIPRNHQWKRKSRQRDNFGKQMHTISEIKKVIQSIQGWTNKASCLSISNHIRCWDFDITTDKILFYKCFIWSSKSYAGCLHMYVHVSLRHKLNYTAFLAHKNQWNNFGSIANRICY